MTNRRSYVDWFPPPEDISLFDTQSLRITRAPSRDIASLDTRPQSIPLTQKPRQVSRNPHRLFTILFLLSMSIIIIVSATIIVPALKTPTVVPTGAVTHRTVVIPTPTPTFDPDVGAV